MVKNLFPEKINFDDLPHFRGQKNFRTYQNFSKHKSQHFPPICPIFLYNKPILPDCGANIARLALFAQQTGGAGANPCIKDHFNDIREIFKTNRETWRSARKPGDSRVNRETWQLWVITMRLFILGHKQSIFIQKLSMTMSLKY